MSTLSTAWSHVSSAREWLGRHRRSLLIAGGLGAASVCGWAYWRFKPMYDQLRAELRLMERMANDMNDTATKQQLSAEQPHSTHLTHPKQPHLPVRSLRSDRAALYVCVCAGCCTASTTT